MNASGHAPFRSKYSSPPLSPRGGPGALLSAEAGGNLSHVSNTAKATVSDAEKTVLREHDGPLCSLRFSRDGTTVATVANGCYFFVVTMSWAHLD